MLSGYDAQQTIDFGRGRVLPQALHRARLQPCFRGRGRSTGRRKCLRPCAALSASLLRSLLSLNPSYGKRARSASAGRAFPVFRKAHCAFTHIRKPPGTVCRLDALQLQTLSIRTGGRSPRLAFSPVSSGASQASYGAAGSGTRLPNGARSLSRRRNANASSSAQPVRPVRSL